MSYDIDLVSKKTGKTVMLKNPLYVRGGTVKAELTKDGRLVQAIETEASINITYNYSQYYYDATEGDSRFQKKDEDGKIITGIRGLYGMTPAESIPVITDMVMRIQQKYKDENGKWIHTERTRKHYFDKDGNEIKDVIGAIMNHEVYSETEEKYIVSEGDTSNYWERTAANAIRPLYDMIYMAVDCLTEDCYWDGD